MRIGAHVSGEVPLARVNERAREIGAECAQFFVSPPQSWRSPAHAPAEIEAYRAARQASDVAPQFLHSIYLINLASGDVLLRERSLRSLVTYLEWAQRLGADGVITHLGSGRDVGPEEARRLIAASLERALATAQSEVSLLLETTAGGGSLFGGTFEELGGVINDLGRPPRLRVCLDTAHVFAAGLYDGTADGLERLLAGLDATAGLERLAAVHLNDSKTAFGSRHDRHANVGEGLLGAEGLGAVLRHPALAALPFILEVPGRNRGGPQRRDLEAARALARGEDLPPPAVMAASED
ncbi:MAG: deoxyribonuclease IV [Chloroflexota bacterium]